MRDEQMMDMALDIGERATAANAAEDAARFAQLRQRYGQLHGARRARG
jgi:hypothetical protein